MSDKKEAGLITWDYKGQIDIAELNILLKIAGFKGSINEVETSSDQNAIVVSPVVITDDKAQDYYEENLWEDTDD